MAKDNFDIDWDDPFGGDFDLDMDFDLDPYAKKGFIGGMTSGFLSGIVDETIGTDSARMRSLRTILPKSFSNALDKVSWASDRFDELATDFKEQNYESAKSLQSIAGKLSEKMSDRLPSFINEKLESFSEKDFSHWERNAGFGTDQATMDQTTQYDVDAALQSAMDRQEGMFSSLGDSLNSMSAHVGGMITGSIMAGNRQLIGIESGVKSLNDYQRNVQLKMDQAKLNLMAKNYVADVKFYKFMEKAQHLTVSELRKITKNSAMSDYQKTSTFTASKDYLRNKMFSTIGKRVGGLTGLVREKYGKNARQETYSGVETILSGLAEALEMGSDMPMSKGFIGSMLGKHAAGSLINNLPYFFERGKGKELIEKLAKRNPEKAASFQKHYGKLTDLGHQVSYLANSNVGLINYLAENYQAMDEMPFLDYEDYLDSLKPGQKAIGKARWTVQNAASNRAKASFNTFMAEMTKAKGTQYTLSRRNVKDLNQPGIWKEMNNITLNEVLPGLLSRIHQSVEGLRTGKEADLVSYSHMRGEFMGTNEKKTAVQADLMPYSEFSRYASAALEFVDSMDPDKILSPAARKAFAQQVAKDVDQEKGFNPFYYLGTITGISPSHQNEIHAVMKRHFGIDQEMISQFNQASGFDRLKIMSNMPTSESKARLNTAAASASNLKDIFPNVAERIDLLRSTGNEQMLRDLGVIYTEGGLDKVNMQMFHDRIGMFMDDPNNPILRGMTGKTSKGVPTATGFTLPKSSNTGASGPGFSETINDFSSTVDKLTKALQDIKTPSETPTPTKTSFGLGENTVSDISRIATSTGNMENLFSEFMETVRAGELLRRPARSKTEEATQDKVQKNFARRVKDLFPSKLFGKGIDLIVQNQPMVFGTLLGTLGASFVQNPILAGSLAVGGLALGGLVQHWGRSDLNASVGKEPDDSEDILDENGETILSSKKLSAGLYLDAVTRRVVKTWKEIRGPIFDAGSKVVIGVKELAGKIFGPDGRAVVLSGIQKAKDAVVGAYNFLDPLGKIKSMVELGKEFIYQQDVYVKGEKNPRLRSIKFKEAEYFIEDSSGQFKPIFGWNEIEGPVYDSDGNELISQAEYDAGLITSSGQAVRKVGSMGANAVGAIAGGAKATFDRILGKFGFQRTNQTGPGSSSTNSGGVSGTEHRLDKIYALLSKQFGISVDDDDVNSAQSGKSDWDRLNSLADKERKAKEESREETNDAIKDIASALKGDKKEDKTEKKEGIFGKLLGMFGGIGKFGKDFLKNPLGAIGGAILGSMGNSLNRLATIGSVLFSSVLGPKSPIFKLLRWGFTGLGKMLGMRSLTSGLTGAGGGGLLSKAGKMFSKLPGWGKALGIAAAGGAALYGGDALADSFGGGDDPFAEDPISGQKGDFFTPQLSAQEQKYLERQQAREARDNPKGDKPWYTDPASAIAEMVPSNAAAKFIVENLFGETPGSRDLYMSDDGKRFLSKSERDKYEDERDGIVAPSTLTRDPSKSFTIQKQIRYAQYGLNDFESSLGKRIDALEQWLIPYVSIMGNRASFRDDTPIKNIIQQFAAGSSPIPYDNIHTWFVARFKPIFLIYNVGISVAKMGDINEFDQNKTYESLQVCERLVSSIATVEPYPLKIQIQIDPSEGLMNEAQTGMKVNQLMAKMRKEYPTPKANTLLATVEESRARALQEEPKSDNPIIRGFQNFFGDTAARDRQLATDKRYQSPKEIKEIDITDMHKDNNTPMDPFTFVRLGVYGNVDNMPWRVDAVLRLERYVEDYMKIMNGRVEYTGETKKIFELFKAMFRIDGSLGESNWTTWFEYRFIPVMKRYVGNVDYYRSGKPKAAWQQLSDTNKVVIARGLSELLIINPDGEEVSIWTIEAGPFAGSKSGTSPDRVEKYLKMLDAKSSESTLKDPELEEEKSKTTAQRLAAQTDRQQKVENTNRLFDRVYGTNRQSAAGNVGINGGGSGMGFNSSGGASTWSNSFKEIQGGGGQYEGSWSSGYNPDFAKNAGDDAGIKMSKQEGDRLMLNTMLKNGITDKKQLALGLAMARKETGTYSSTVENTNWSAPTLKKYFRNIPDMATAEKVAAMPPPERAMYVYGKPPKGPSLGNEKPEDGWLYRGRGFFQLTGKDNYVRMSKELGTDLVSNPRLVSEDPEIIAESAVRFLKNSKAMMDIGQTGNFETAVRCINGGNAVPATDERRRYYQEYLQMLNSGELSIPGEVANQTVTAGSGYGDDVPAGADKDVPKDKVSDIASAADTTKNVSTVTAPSSGTPMPATAAKPIYTEQENMDRAKTAVPASLAKPSTNKPSQVSAPPSLAAPTSIAPQSPKVVSKPEEPTGPLLVKDEQMASVSASLTQTLDNLNRTLAEMNRNSNTVHN